MLVTELILLIATFTVAVNIEIFWQQTTRRASREKQKKHLEIGLFSWKKMFILRSVFYDILNICTYYCFPPLWLRADKSTEKPENLCWKKCVLCVDCAQETIISIRCFISIFMYTCTIPVASNNPKNEKRDIRNRNQITHAESVPMGQYFLQQFHFGIISDSLSSSYFYQAVPVFLHIQLRQISLSNCFRRLCSRLFLYPNFAMNIFSTTNCIICQPCVMAT